MAELSYLIFWAGFLCIIGAAAMFVVYFFGRRVTRFAASTGHMQATAEITEVSPPVSGSIAMGLSRAAALCLGLAVITRAMAAGRPPYGSLWEYLQALAFGSVLVFVLFELKTHERAAGLIVMPALAGLLAASETLLSHEIQPLVPALLNDRLLAIHVAAMLVAYSALSVAFGSGAISLLQTERRRFPRLPDAERSRRLADEAIMIGFPLLGLGIILGAYWGNIAWGRYWGWDPKESTALVSWLVYAGYMHVRHLNGWQTRSTFIGLAGYAVILFNVFAVNFVIAGLHSYAGA